MKAKDILYQVAALPMQAGSAGVSPPVPPPPSIGLQAASPASGIVAVQSAPMLVTWANLVDPVLITPTVAPGPGTFSPATISAGAGSGSAQIRLTPLAAAVHQVALANNAGILPPAPVLYTAAPAPAPVPQLTLSLAASTGTVDAALPGNAVINTGSVAASWTLSAAAGLNFSPASGTTAPGSSTPFTMTPVAAAAYTVILSSAGAQITGNGAPFTAAAGSSPPVAVTVDIATPEQIGFYALPTRVLDPATVIAVQYRATGATTWRTGHWMMPIRGSEIETGSPTPVVDAFGGLIIDLTPGSSYDYQLTVTEPGHADAVISGTAATRALPAAAGTPNKTANPGNLQTVLNGLVPGDVLQLVDGLYSGNFTLAVGSKTGAPIYIRGTSRTSTIISAASGTALLILLATNNVVIENLKWVGSGVDSGTAASSSAILFNDSTNVNFQENVCIRQCTFVGFDKGIKSYYKVSKCLVYENEFTGNNTWDKAYLINPLVGLPNYSWNDDGITLPGTANCAWNNTLRGFGDSFAHYGDHSNAGSIGINSWGVHYYRNLIEYTCDDGCEADGLRGNCSFYDNFIGNAGTLCSLDPIYGGPFVCARNTAINLTRGPFKITSQNTGGIIAHNTTYKTNQQAAPAPDLHYGQYISNNGAQLGFEFVNNLQVYLGSGPGAGTDLRIECNFDRVRWRNNGWYPNTGFNWTNAGGNFASAALAAAGLPARSTLYPFDASQRHANDRGVEAAPWVSTPALGPDYTTQNLNFSDLILSGSSQAKAAGVALPGISDGFTGAAPDLGAKIAGRPLVAYGASPTSGAAVWTKGIPVGTWGQIPGNRVLDISPDTDSRYNPNSPPTVANAPWRAEVVGGLDGLMRAWCGMCFDTAAGVGYIPNGEGHRDGFSNASYKWDLNRAVPQWSVIHGPSIQSVYVDLLSYTGVWQDGRKRSLHTYNGLAFVPNLGPIVANEITLSPSGGTRGATPSSVGPGALYVVDPVTGDHAEKAFHGVGGGGGMASCYDSIRDAVWYTNAGAYQFEYWSKATNTWTVRLASTPAQGSFSMCHMPDSDCLLIGNGEELPTDVPIAGLGQWFAGGYVVLDCVTGTLHQPTFTGAPALHVPHNGGIWPGKSQPSWDPVRRCAYVWDNTTNREQILRLTPGANPRTSPWTVDTIPVSGSNSVTPSQAQGQGTYGRAFYWPAQDVFIVLNGVDEHGYFFRLS